MITKNVNLTDHRVIHQFRGTASNIYIIEDRADNLRHIRSLKRVFPEAALTSGTSIDLIMRSPVAMEYDIG
ncbi:MAG: hypothetical protein JRG87_10835 [Deltaproteobacteria bacterium]|nr:hypothetical protein [Deltaproteobacteria bacterium]